ncbi:MAG TPA: paraquat-inducible protein A [Eoetvoesiella sp.]
MATCIQCGYVLYRQSSLPIKGWIAFTLATLIVFAIANYFPIATLSVNGLVVHASLPEALAITWQQGHELVAIMTGLFSFVMPLGQICFVLWALQVVDSGRLPADFRYGMRVLNVLEPWSMIPVLLLGILVAIVKLAGMAILTVEPGLWGFAVLSVMLTALSRVSAHRIWRYAEDRSLVPRSGDGIAFDKIVAACSACGFVQNISSLRQNPPCHRCGAGVHFRHRNPLSRGWALVVAASILYIPANILPVMQISMPTGSTSHTILGGVIELWHLGSWDLALIVFVASVVVPMTKLLALIVLMVNRDWRGDAVQRQRTRLYELVEFIGQWSMLDVFVVILLSAMANFPGLTQITAGYGAASFGMVVILTMLAAMSYDPRTGWDGRTTVDKSSGDLTSTPENGRSASSGAI